MAEVDLNNSIIYSDCQLDESDPIEFQNSPPKKDQN